MTRVSKVLAVLGVLALVGAACNNSTSPAGGTSLQPFHKIGPGEGHLSLIAWQGYVENGSNSPHYDWVHPFEQQTGCQVSVKYADTSDEMVTLMRSSGGKLYDGVSASGNASNRLIAGGDVRPIDTSLFPDFKNVIGPLKAPPHNTVNGVHYGTPYMYGPNFLMYNPNVVKPAPTSWVDTFSPNSPYAGKVTAYDDPIYIADAAMYLKAHNPSLRITDPYELTQTQFNAAVNLLKAQKPILDKYWSLYTTEINGFENGDMVIGTAWPINLSIAESDYAAGKSKNPVAQVVPSEGVTGWADTWMMSSHAPDPNCMMMWMKYTMTAKVQAQVALWYGAAGSNVQSCPLIAKALGKSANLVHTVRYGECGSVSFLNHIYFWKTPQVACGDSRGNTCVDYSKWLQAWTDIKG